jgi:hypothetical protein
VNEVIHQADGRTPQTDRISMRRSHRTVETMTTPLVMRTSREQNQAKQVQLHNFHEDRL